MRVLKAGFFYFAIVFATGFALGIVRTLLLVPRLGERRAELLELPVMLLASYVAARLIVRRLGPFSASQRAGMGLLALSMLVVAELSIPWMQGVGIGAYIASRDPVSGSAYLLSLALFAAMPVIAGSVHARRADSRLPHRPRFLGHDVERSGRSGDPHVARGHRPAGGGPGARPVAEDVQRGEAASDERISNQRPRASACGNGSGRPGGRAHPRQDGGPDTKKARFGISSTLQQPHSRSARLPILLLAAFAAWWVALAIAPRYREDWLLENVLVVVAVPLLVAGYRRLRFSNLAYVLLFVFFMIHAVGAHYTYSEVPYRAWLGTLGFDIALEPGRNHFDRFAHFLYGLCITPAAVELLDARAPQRGVWRWIVPMTFMLAQAAVYELIEWAAAGVFGGDLGVAYLGTQGDAWDSQKDTALAGLGALIAVLLWRAVPTARLPDERHPPA